MLPTDPATLHPVTVSGWYERTDGTVAHYYWDRTVHSGGFLRHGQPVDDWSLVPADPITDAELAAALGEI